MTRIMRRPKTNPVGTVTCGYTATGGIVALSRPKLSPLTRSVTRACAITASIPFARELAGAAGRTAPRAPGLWGGIGHER